MVAEARRADLYPARKRLTLVPEIGLERQGTYGDLQGRAAENVAASGDGHARRVPGGALLPHAGGVGGAFGGVLAKLNGRRPGQRQDRAALRSALAHRGRADAHGGRRQGQAAARGVVAIGSPAAAGLRKRVTAGVARHENALDHEHQRAERGQHTEPPLQNVPRAERPAPPAFGATTIAVEPPLSARFARRSTAPIPSPAAAIP